jgi:hypothetical protein
MKVKVERKRWYPCPHNEAEMIPLSEPYLLAYLGFLFQATLSSAGDLLTQIKTRTQSMENENVSMEID